MKNRKRILVLFLIGLALLLIGYGLLTYSRQNIKENLPVYEKNDSSKIKEIHESQNLKLSDMTILRSNQIEAFTGNISNEGSIDLEKVSITIFFMDEKGKEIASFEVRFDHLPADKKKYYFEGTIDPKGIVDSTNYRFEWKHYE